MGSQERENITMVTSFTALFLFPNASLLTIPPECAALLSRDRLSVTGAGSSSG